jgi:DNA-binding transcriptional LysR family regulator
MDRIRQMKVFIAVADLEGFSSAARHLRMSPPAVTRAVAELERGLGVKLLTRTTRYLRVTDAGQRYLHDIRRILADVAAADDAVAGVTTQPRGQLTITAPVLFGRKFVVPGIVDYLKRYPEVDIAAVFLDRVVNLLEEGFEVGVRIGRLADSTMRALHVGEVRQVVVAAPSYLANYGVPARPDELRSHTIVASQAGNGALHWRFGPGRGGRPGKGSDLKTVRVRPRLEVTTNDAAIDAVVGGFGISRLLSYQVADLIATDKLQALLVDYQGDDLPVNIVHREGQYPSAKVRSFVDLLATRLRVEFEETSKNSLPNCLSE